MSEKTPSPGEVCKMREFLARVVRTPMVDIKVTGKPATEANTDLLLLYSRSVTGSREIVSMKKLCPLRAVRIDNLLSGHTDPDGEPDLARGTAMFAAYIGERQPIHA